MLRKPHSGFTLVELLVVMVIIAILMGLLFPAINVARQSAYKAQAANDLQQIVGAVKGYYADYGKYPLTDAQVKSGLQAVYGDPNGAYTSSQLFNVLCYPSGFADNQNASGPQNPRKVVYLSLNNVKNATAPKSGLDTKGNYYDPWGSTYVVFIDALYQNYIDVTGGYTDPNFTLNNSKGPSVGVGVATLGKDLSWGSGGNKIFKGSDDIVSWQ